MSSIATGLEAFEIAASDEILDDLSRRLRAARLSAEDTNGWNAGTSPAYLRELIAYWRDRFDWRAQERRLNRFPQFRVEVDGTRVHFIHQRGRGPRPLSLLLTHGFPDFCFRFSKLIPLLTDPSAHGGDPADAFDVVAPSLPGYAFSEIRMQKGGLFGFGDLWHALMTEVLGYQRFGAHGGDWGSTVTEQLARSHASSLVGIHLTDVPFWHIFQPPDDLSPDERRYLDENERWQREDGAYAMIQSTRPQTAAPGLLDSPAGLAAWIVEKFQEWSDCGGNLERCYTKDEVLTNIMLYWITGTIGSSFQPYHDIIRAGPARWMKEKAKEWLGSSRTPAGFAMFPKDISSPPREWAERFFDVQRWTAMPRGGHFAALEEPAALAEEIQAFFRPLR